MNKKGFTLIELLAVIIILGILSLITIPAVINFIENARKDAFIISVNSVYDAYEYQEAINDYENIGTMNVQSLDIMNKITLTGLVYRKNGMIIVEEVTDGQYCAFGTKENLQIFENECEIVDNTPPEIKSFTITSTSTKVIATVIFSEPDSFIKNIKFRLLDNDNVVIDYIDYDTLSGSVENRVATKEFDNLQPNKTYIVEVTIQNAATENNTTTDSKEVETHLLNKPIISYNTSNWELSKTVTITYDNNYTNTYKILDYNNNLIEHNTVDGTIKTIEISNYDYTIIATSNDGINSQSETVRIGYIDRETPNIPTITSSDSILSNSWHINDFTLSFTGSFSKSEVSYYYGLDESNMIKSSTLSINTNTSETTYYIKACNQANTCSSIINYIVKLDKENPSVTLNTLNTTTNSITVQAISSSLSGINKYEFSIDGVNYINNNTIDTYTFSNLTTGTYEVYVKVTSISGNTNIVSKSITTTNMTTPTISYDAINYAHSKTVTITYPSGFTGTYKIGSGNWSNATTPVQTITVTTNGETIMARSYDGTNYSGSTISTIGKIDNTKPVVTVGGISSSWTSYDDVTLSLTDNLSGVSYYCVSSTNDSNNCSWSSITNSTNTNVSYRITSNGTYYAFTKDLVGNISDSKPFTVDKIDNATSIQIPTISSSDSKASNTWHSTNFTLSFTESSSLSGITYYYGTSISNMTSIGSSISITSNASTTYYVKACNALNVCSGNASYIAKLDKNAPTITAKGSSYTITQGASNVISNIYFNIDGNGLAGITSTSCVDTSNSNASVSNTSTLGAGTHSIKCTVTKENGLSNNASVNIIIGGPTKVMASSGDTHKGIVYLDPTNLTKTCNASNSVSTPGIKTGCMKWYIFDDSGSTYKMILDHNTRELTGWSSRGTNGIYGYSEGAGYVLSYDTSSWDNSLIIRLISADEIAKIVGYTTFNQETADSDKWFYFDGSHTPGVHTTPGIHSQGESKYGWLFDYTYGCTSYGCNKSMAPSYGYWTSSPVVGTSDFAWTVTNTGALGYSNVGVSDNVGIRPVIEISKNLLN